MNANEIASLTRDLDRYRRLRANCASDDRTYVALNELIAEIEKLLQTARRSAAALV